MYVDKGTEGVRFVLPFLCFLASLFLSIFFFLKYQHFDLWPLHIDDFKKLFLLLDLDGEFDSSRNLDSSSWSSADEYSNTICQKKKFGFGFLGMTHPTRAKLLEMRAAVQT